LIGNLVGQLSIFGKFEKKLIRTDGLKIIFFCFWEKYFSVSILPTIFFSGRFLPKSKIPFKIFDDPKKFDHPRKNCIVVGNDVLIFLKLVTLKVDRKFIL
jgi:hypothetical protein